jgi:hypothetical protein
VTTPGVSSSQLSHSNAICGTSISGSLMFLLAKPRLRFRVRIRRQFPTSPQAASQNARSSNTYSRSNIDRAFHNADIPSRLPPRECTKEQHQYCTTK